MTTRENIGILIVGILGCTLVLQRCNKPHTVKGPAQITYANGGDTLVISQPNHKPITIYQPDPNSTVITTDKHGNVTVHVRQFGVGFEPGIGMGYSDRTRLALDGRLVYFKRFGVHSGLGVDVEPKDYRIGAKLLDLVDPYVGVSYVPTVKLPNTSLVLSYTAAGRVFGFVRLRF